jgi:hypothetical protein
VELVRSPMMTIIEHVISQIQHNSSYGGWTSSKEIAAVFGWWGGAYEDGEEDAEDTKGLGEFVAMPEQCSSGLFL